MNKSTDTTPDPMEERLGYYTLPAPPPGLRDRVLAAAATKPALPRAEIALRWALAALVLTFIWASWMERRTGEWMARIAEDVPEPALMVAEEQMVMEKPEGPLMTALMEPRRRLPLEPGIRDTRLRLSPSSILVLPKGGPA